MRSLHFRISGPLNAQLRRFCRQQDMTVSDVVREALRRYLAIAQFQELRAQVVPAAQAQGIITDQDVFDAVS